MSKISVFLPAIFLVMQLTGLFFGLSSVGEFIITSQLTIIILEIRRSFWSEKDYIEAERLMFKLKFWRK